MFYWRACCECAVFSPLVIVTDVLGFLQRGFGGSGLRSAAVSRHVDDWYAEPDSKAVVDVVADAAVRVAAADPDFESLRRCSPDECDISKQSSGGPLGMPVVVHVPVTVLGLDESVGVGYTEIHVAS